MVSRLRTFAVINEVGPGGALVMVAAAFANSLAVSLFGLPLRQETQMRVVRPLLLFFSGWQLCKVSPCVASSYNWLSDHIAVRSVAGLSPEPRGERFFLHRRTRLPQQHRFWMCG